MRSLRVGDTVAFLRNVAEKYASKEIAKFRGVATGIAGRWLFLEDATSGRTRVMAIENMYRVAPDRVILELV